MTKRNDTGYLEDFDLVDSYTRADALRDGTLIDVSVAAAEAGFSYPVALTSAVFQSCVEVPAELPCQDEDGRLWDVVWMLRYAIQKSGKGKPELLFELHVQKKTGAAAELVTLKSVCGPGDRAEPVITVMFPEED